MRLDDLEHNLEQGTGRGFARYRGVVADVTGDERYGLAIAGPDSLVREAFAETDFAPSIIPGGSQDEWDKAMEEQARRAARGSTEVFALDQPTEFFKSAPEAAKPESTVLVTLRNLRPGGTLFSLDLLFFVPQGALLVFTLPPMWVTLGSLFPLTGDPDLDLSLNSWGRPVRASRLPGTAVDSVFFSTNPFAQFVPFFTVNGFVRGFTAFHIDGWSGVF